MTAPLTGSPRSSFLLRPTSTKRRRVAASMAMTAVVQFTAIATTAKRLSGIYLDGREKTANENRSRISQYQTSGGVF